MRYRHIGERSIFVADLDVVEHKAYISVRFHRKRLRYCANVADVPGISSISLTIGSISSYSELCVDSELFNCSFSSGARLGLDASGTTAVMFCSLSVLVNMFIIVDTSQMSVSSVRYAPRLCTTRTPFSFRLRQYS